MQRKLAMIVLGIFCSCIIALGQNVKPRLNNLSLSSLNAFNTKGEQWKIVGAVTSAYSDTLTNCSWRWYFIE
ncbi:MAG: hypothetical protein RL000_1744 [Bacteroidota bacterium]